MAKKLILYHCFECKHNTCDLCEKEDRYFDNEDLKHDFPEWCKLEDCNEM
jgi:hypothetical protein